MNRHREFTRMKALDGGVYESRWGAVGGPFETGQGLLVGGYVAAVVDPDLTAADRARLSRPLRSIARSHPTSKSALTAGVSAWFALMFGAVVVNPGVLGLLASVVVATMVGAAAWWVALWMWRRAAVIPEELRDHVVVAAVKPPSRQLGGGATCRHPVVDAAMNLGEIENTTGVDDAAVEAQWRSTWARLSRREDLRTGTVSWS